CAAVVIAHNHPAGDPTPSQADRTLTTRLVNALNMVDIRVLDHLIIGESEPVSLAELGWLPC
ncbi:JAB domain-containing protein, partial [Yersinia similis]